MLGEGLGKKTDRQTETKPERSRGSRHQVYGGDAGILPQPSSPPFPPGPPEWWE